MKQKKLFSFLSKNSATLIVSGITGKHFCWLLLETSFTFDDKHALSSLAPIIWQNYYIFQYQLL